MTKKNKVKNKVLACILSLAMLVSMSGSVYAADNTDIIDTGKTVYILLDAKGEAKEIIVKGNNVEEKNVTGELPFKVKISYMFDNIQVVPQDILGMSGDVKITVDISANAKTKDYYKENLALQMQFPIDTKDNSAVNIVAEGLTGVTVGSIKTLSGIVLPSKSAKYEISYRTTAFEQQSINFVCMPFDMTGMIDINISSIESQVGELQNGVVAYVDGVGELSRGLSAANAGIKEISASGTKLVGSYTQATAGENELIKAMLATMTPEMQKNFTPQIEAIQAAQQQIAAGFSAYADGVAQASMGLEQLTVGAVELAKGGDTLKSGINSAIAPLFNIDLPEQSKNAPDSISFLSDDKVSEIQFVMKTDALAATVIKPDVLPAEKPKQSFWDRLTALFGI